MRRARREADELAAEEDGDDEADVRLVRGAVVGVVVDDDVARLPLEAELREATVDAGDVARDRPRLQRRRLGRLAELPALGVAEDAAEVLRLPDDRGVGHPGQLVAHLDRDRVERAGDHSCGDRVDACLDGAHRAPTFVRIRLPEASARTLPARRHDRRGVEVEDHRRPGDRLAERQQAAVVEARLQALEAAADAEDALALAHERLLQAPTRHGQRVEVGPPADRGHTRVDDLDRVAVGAAVLALVQDVELLERRLGEGPLGERHAQLVALADVAAVERADHLDVRSGNAVALEPAAQLRLELVELAVQPVGVDAALELEDGAHLVVLQVARQQPARRGDPGMRRHEHLGDLERVRDLRGMERAGAAEGDERELARVVALLDRARANRPGHVRVGDREDPLGGLEQAEPELVGEPLHDRNGGVAVERHPPAEEPPGVEPAEHEVRVADRRLLRRRCRSTQGPGSRRRCAGRPGRRPPRRRRRSSRRRRRSYARRASARAADSRRPRCLGRTPR